MNSKENGLAAPYFDMEFLSNRIMPLLSDYQSHFSQIEFGRGLDTYIDRATKIGLEERGNVLDAGGGIGNWAIALAGLNVRVEVVDISAERLFVGRTMAENMSIKNINFTNMSIEHMNFPDNHFDAIICYSVIMFTDVKKTLAEFRRVLRPGGRLYIQADLWSWYFGQGAPERRRLQYFIKLIMKLVLLRTPKLLTIKGFQSSVSSAGFRIVSVGQDGETSFKTNSARDVVKSFYPTRASGREELIEICAERI